MALDHGLYTCTYTLTSSLIPTESSQGLGWFQFALDYQSMVQIVTKVHSLIGWLMYKSQSWFKVSVCRFPRQRSGVCQHVFGQEVLSSLLVLFYLGYCWYQVYHSFCLHWFQPHTLLPYLLVSFKLFLEAQGITLLGFQLARLTLWVLPKV